LTFIIDAFLREFEVPFPKFGILEQSKLTPSNSRCVLREYARAPRGEIIEETRRGKKFDRVNVIGALCNGEHSAIECYRHTTQSKFFEDWCEKKLVKEIPKGYTVIMDNAGFHRKKEVRKIARGKVRLLFLPPYTPDYNPIEKSWVNMKRYLRDNLKDPQSVVSGIYTYF
jgi:transposase